MRKRRAPYLARERYETLGKRTQTLQTTRASLARPAGARHEDALHTAVERKSQALTKRDIRPCKEPAPVEVGGELYVELYVDVRQPSRQ